MKRFLVLLAVAATGCGRLASDDPAQRARSGGGSPLYEADATVLEDSTHGPELCLGGVMESLPPQCGGVPITNWDWSEVEGEESRSGASWGTFHVVGTYDGDRFTVVEVGPARSDGAGDADSVEAACPDPEVGWVPPSPRRQLQPAIHAARSEPDFAGVWVDTAESGPANGETILSVAFTGDLERHEQDLRRWWGGPLCVVRHDTTLDELLRIQRELTDAPLDGLDIQVLWSAPDETRGVLEVGVVAADDADRAAVDERYGAGVVELFPALRPVS